MKWELERAGGGDAGGGVRRREMEMCKTPTEDAEMRGEDAGMERGNRLWKARAGRGRLTSEKRKLPANLTMTCGKVAFTTGPSLV